MTRQADQEHEDRQVKRDNELVQALEFELVRSLSRSDITLLGFSAKFDQYQCLITLRALVDDILQVSFVSSETIPQAIRKCVVQAKYDTLKWKLDEWAK